ncbi:FMN-binding negative transcriptional regulator [Paenibacillaceae bacterium]|nr:FMN-binding negative transcriptional regulator [Paenibacillaceae bacterium]
MYVPQHYKVEDEASLFDFIERNSFGLLFSSDNNRPVASHLPLLLDRANNCLYGHFARVNTQWQDIEGQEVLAVFHGPHCYISASWYETKASAPTWNYTAVHVHGSIELIEDQEGLLAILKRTVNQYEQPDSSYRIDESNKPFVDRLIHGIVGFKLHINSIEGQWKLSQDDTAERRERVIDQLEKSPHENERTIAQLMKERF